MRLGGHVSAGGSSDRGRGSHMYRCTHVHNVQMYTGNMLHLVHIRHHHMAAGAGRINVHMCGADAVELVQRTVENVLYASSSSYMRRMDRSRLETVQSNRSTVYLVQPVKTTPRHPGLVKN